VTSCPKEKGPLICGPVVELPGIEPGTKTVLNCGNAQSDCAKRREST
jgi:hypothetical protein